MKIPIQVQSVIKQLKQSGYEAYIVGGCVRDMLRNIEPQDWDIATNAKPKEIEKLFLYPPKFSDGKFGWVKSFSNNKFGTATILTGSKNLKLKEIEITPYRIDEQYTDKRHPDKIKWVKTIEEDLARRDFTINAIAIEEAKKLKIIDIFKGQEDLKNKVIRAVGKAEDRFSEDALRMLRAIRFVVTLSPKIWRLEEKTNQAIEKNAHFLQFISKERIRDELMKIIASENGAKGIEILRRIGLLKYIIPELEEGFAVGQNKHHIYQIYQHNLLSLNYACQKNFSKYVRLAALLHDIGKPRTKGGEGVDSTFYNHEIVGAKMTYQILIRLKFPKKDIEKVVRLVRYHLFYYNVGEVGDSSVRRLLRKVGQENIEELLELRYCDRIGSSVPKAEPYKLRHLKYLFEKVSQDPISVRTLKMSGNDIMDILAIKPGQKIGQILYCLLGQVLADPDKNNKKYLKEEIKKLGKLSDKKLADLTALARDYTEKIETKKDEMTKKKYWVG